MPWDGTELRVAQISEGVLGRGRLVKGGMRESVLAPVWRDETSLYVVSDWPGWWNLYQVGLVGEPAQALYPAEEEFAEPLWQLGGRPYAMLGDGRLAVLHGQGGMRLGAARPGDGGAHRPRPAVPGVPWWRVRGREHDRGGGRRPADSRCRWSGSTRPPGSPRCCAGRPTRSRRPGTCRCRARSGWRATYGRNVHALVYPPTHPDAVAPDGELPPYIVWAHGGPTSHVVGLLDLEKAYFTSRGIGVIDVNYGGSTGYGRSYRERLRMQWGVVDVEDAVAAGLALADKDEADPRRLGIRGASAGGWTALAAVTTQAARQPVFSAAASYFGVADLREFAAETHDFESHYLDGLIGPLPGFEYVYAERSPAGHVTDATCPVLLLQGLDDPIVPPRQAESIAADLSAHGIRHALLTFKGESHGFRRTETIIAALEAELSFYGQVLGFTPPGIPQLTLTEPRQLAQEAVKRRARAKRRAGPGQAAGPHGCGAGAPAAPAVARVSRRLSPAG